MLVERDDDPVGEKVLGPLTLRICQPQIVLKHPPELRYEPKAFVVDVLLEIAVRPVPVIARRRSEQGLSFRLNSGWHADLRRESGVFRHLSANSCTNPSESPYSAEL